MIIHKIFVLLLLTVLSKGMVANKHIVFSKGNSEYSIVVSVDASDSEKYAAEELKSYIEEIGGVKIPIIPCGEGIKGKRIIIGYNQDLKEILPHAICPSSDDESFFYQNCGGDIVIVGGRERGTMYGVFSFLENEMGCRWFTKSYNVIPKRDNYVFSNLDYYDAPAFQKRNMLYSEFRDAEFRVHCRINEKLKTSPAKPEKQQGGCYALLAAHTLGFIMPVDKYYDSHPEYFALRKGKRVKKNTQPCFSNPEVLQICIDGLQKIMRERPEFDIYEISALDNKSHCECEKCKSKIKSLGSFTDVVLDFVNNVAAAVESEFPEKKIEFSAYQNTRTPPVSVKPRKNVIVRISGIESCHIHGIENCYSEEAKEYYQNILGWKTLTEDINIWEYACNFYTHNIPYPNFYALQDNLKTYKRLGVKGVFIEGNHYTYNGEFHALRIYVLGKLLWNPECDLDAIVNDFINCYYGQAAPFIRQYFDLIHSCNNQDVHMTPFAHLDNPYYNDNLIETGLSIFQKARGTIKNDQELLRRVELEGLSVDLLDCFNRPMRAIYNGSYARAKRIIERKKIELRRDELKQKMDQLKLINSLYRKTKAIKARIIKL